MELLGKRIKLELLTEAHKEELYKAAQHQVIWTYNRSKAFGDQFYNWFTSALLDSSNKQQQPFVVRRLSDQTVLGSTRFYDINRENARLAIGYTWFIPNVWGTFVNPESKYLLLQHAFEDLHVNRVEFMTDARNARSRAAIKKLGAKEEGMMRYHMVLENGLLRDTVFFSIIKPEWPEVKNRLLERIKD